MTIKNEQTGGRVTIDELSSALGCNTEDVEQIVRGGSGIEIERAVAPDWQGRPSLPTEVATEALSRTLAAREEHNAKHQAYEAYRKQRAAEAAAERERISREAHEAEQKRVGKFSEERAAQLARETEERVKREQAAAAKRRGDPVSFEEFRER